MGDINQEAIDRNNDRILKRFSPEFKKQLNTNQMYHSVYMSLSYGGDEYTIIEELLKVNKTLSEDLIKISKNRPPIYILKK